MEKYIDQVKKLIHRIQYEIDELNHRLDSPFLSPEHHFIYRENLSYAEEILDVAQDELIRIGV